MRYFFLSLATRALDGVDAVDVWVYEPPFRTLVHRTRAKIHIFFLFICSHLVRHMHVFMIVPESLCIMAIEHPYTKTKR